MSLWVQVVVGPTPESGVLVADAVVHNVSNLSDISDYVGKRYEKGNPNLNIERGFAKIKINGHNRKSSVWDLVRKIAEYEPD